MSTRRQMFHLVTFLSLWVPSRRAWRTAGNEWAVGFIRQIGNETADIVASGAPAPERRERLQTLVDRAADVDGAARFCLGRFWRKASPEYVGLFHTILMKVLLTHINAESQTRTTVKVTI